MPIKMTCRECGKQLVLKDEFAGKKGKCPSCGTLLAIPTAKDKPTAPAKTGSGAPAPGGASPGKGRTCPGCGKQLPQGAIVCMDCGTNLVTGATTGATTGDGSKLLAGSTRVVRLVVGLLIIAALVVFAVLAVSKVLTSAKIVGKTLGPEQKVVQVLREIAGAQSGFKREAEVDQNANGNGEYGLLAELANEVRSRNPKSVLSAHKGRLSFAFSTGGRDGKGTADRRGYYFRMYLASPDQGAGDDRSLGGTPDKPGQIIEDESTVSLQEKSFVCYAWPHARYANGVHAFAIDQNGEVYCTGMGARVYAGSDGPDASAAYADKTVFGGKMAPGTGADGNAWAPVADAEAPAWKTSVLTSLIFNLNTPWFTPEAVKQAKPIEDIEELCRNALAKMEQAKKAEMQDNWRKAELLYRQAVTDLGSRLWPEKTLARRLKLLLENTRLVLEAGKLENEGKLDEATAAYKKALPVVHNRAAIEKRIAGIKEAQRRVVAAQQKAKQTDSPERARRVADATRLLDVVKRLGNPYSSMALAKYGLSSKELQTLHPNFEELQATAKKTIAADPKTYPPLRKKKGITFDLVHLKNGKTPIKGIVTERGKTSVKVDVVDKSGKSITRLLQAGDVEKIETREVSAKELNDRLAQELYAEAARCIAAGTYVQALTALGKLDLYFPDAAVCSNAELQKRAAAPIAKPGASLTPAALLERASNGGIDEMCLHCLGTKRLRCARCMGTGHRKELTKCRVCDGTGKVNCAICSGTRVRQGACMTCKTRGTITCTRCKGEGTIHPYVTCKACKGTGRTNDRCLKCRGTGNDPRTHGPCKDCNGTGKVACPVCKGKGNCYSEQAVTCNICAGTKRIACPNCAGTGRAPVKTKCTRCNGKGKGTCPKCKGTGRVNGKTCPLCKGNRIAPCPACQGTGKPLCRACGGTGKETCGTCEGRGKVPMKCKHCENGSVVCGHCKGTGKRPRR